MTNCRMCSQRLPRPGRLCRECERELDRARAVAASVDTLSPAMPLVDVARLANEPPGGWSAQLRSRPTVVVGAFAVGIAAAIAFYVVDLSHASAPGASWESRARRSTSRGELEMKPRPVDFWLSGEVTLTTHGRWP